MKIFTVDAFTSHPFAGNPAGVCLLQTNIADSEMQHIAREINYSETAFLLKKETPGEYFLRWFTPSKEVDLCGHATLASAKVLYEKGGVEKNALLKFDTRSGILTAKLGATGIELDFPSGKTEERPIDPILKKFLGTTPAYVGHDGVWCLMEVSSEKEVRELKPDVELLKTHAQKIFIVTARSSTADFDFVSRCFGPAFGINEDPVTGSAHCYLATYWAEKLNKNTLRAFQASERSGVLECEIIPGNRVLLRGEAVIMSELVPLWKP